MIIKYADRENGELYLVDEQGRTVVLHDSFWEARQSPEENTSKNLIIKLRSAPQMTLPDNLFNGLFNGIQKYHSFLKRDDVEPEAVQNLKRIVESFEEELTTLMRQVDKNSIKNYIYVKSLVLD